MDLQQKIQSQREFLRTYLDSDFGLLGVLLSSKVICWTDIQSIKAGADSCVRNEKLLDFITCNRIEAEFIEALKQTNQTHLANFISSNGEYLPAFGNDWPLSDREIEILDCNHESLVDILETCDLLDRLYSRKVINKRQHQFVSSKPTDYEKNEALLDVLRRRSLSDYRKTIECLIETNQRHIAEVLDEGGVLAKVHAHLDGENVDEEEDQIAASFASQLGNRPLAVSSRILELTQLKIIAAKKGQSIILYVHCVTVEDLTTLRMRQSSGELNIILKTFFNELLSRPKISNFTTTVAEEALEKGVKYFKAMASVCINFVSRLEFGGDGSVMGLTKLRNRINVILRRSDSTSPYCVLLIFEDRKPFLLQKEIKIKEIEDPKDLVSSALENTLYVLEFAGHHDDRRSACVWKIREGRDQTKNYQVMRWLDLGQVDYYMQWTLSVTNDGQLLMVKWRMEESSYYLLVYGEDGCIRSIRLSKHILNPRHAVETSSGNFVVLHCIQKQEERWSIEDWTQVEDWTWMVSEVSGDGKAIVRSFIPESEGQGLSLPSYLSVDSCGRVFVADTLNERVIVLNFDLRWISVFLLTTDDKESRRTKDGSSAALSGPRRVFYDEETNNLLVGGGFFRGEGIDVYKINPRLKRLG